MSEQCNTLPLDKFLSTNLSSKIDCVNGLGDRMKRSLGYPLITLEVHDDQLYQNIQIAIELFTKYAGYTKEFLIFSSHLYQQHKGIRLDTLFSAYERFKDDETIPKTRNSPINFEIDVAAPLYIANQDISLADLPCEWLYEVLPKLKDDGGIKAYSIVTAEEYGNLILCEPGVADRFDRSGIKTPPRSCVLDPTFGDGLVPIKNGEQHYLYNNVKKETYVVSIWRGVKKYGVDDILLPIKSNRYNYVYNTVDDKIYIVSVNQDGLDASNVKSNAAYSYNNAYDYSIMDYRKVISVVDYEEGSSNGIASLFSLEATLAQQNYYAYAMLNQSGFSLTTFYNMKDWMKTREKVLATKKDIHFNDRTQYLQLYPEPRPTDKFYGILECYVERPLKDLIKEQWVYQYALALTKINIGYVRGKYQNVQLLGGGVMNYELLQEGKEEKKRLEDILMTGADAGFGDTNPIDFIVG